VTTSEEMATPGTTAKALRRNRDYRLLVGGSTVSQLGDTAMYIALGIWAVELTGRPSAGGLVFFALSIPALAAPFAGTLIDKLPRRPLLVGLNLVTGILVLLLLLVTSDRLWVMYLVTFLYGLSGVMSSGARTALTAQILPRHQLAPGNGIMESTREGTRLLAPLIGAGAYTAWGPSAVVLGDSFTFLVAASCYFVMRRENAAGIYSPGGMGEAHRAAVMAGLSHMRQDPVLRPLALASALAMVFVGLSETLVFAVARQGLGQSTSFVGVMSAAQGGGAVVAGLLSGRVQRRLGDARTVAAGLLATGLGFLLLVTPNVGAVLGGMVLIGTGLTFCIVGTATSIQARTPTRALGRVATAFDAATSAPQALSIGIGAAVVGLMDYRILLTMIAGALVVATLIARSAARPARLSKSDSSLPGAMDRGRARTQKPGDRKVMRTRTSAEDASGPSTSH